jgi:hypothetical protein
MWQQTLQRATTEPGSDAVDLRSRSNPPGGQSIGMTAAEQGRAIAAGGKNGLARIPMIV